MRLFIQGYSNKGEFPEAKSIGNITRFEDRMESVRIVT